MVPQRFLAANETEASTEDHGNAQAYQLKSMEIMLLAFSGVSLLLLVIYFVWTIREENSSSQVDPEVEIQNRLNLRNQQSSAEELQNSVVAGDTGGPGSNDLENKIGSFGTTLISTSSSLPTSQVSLQQKFSSNSSVKAQAPGSEYGKGPKKSKRRLSTF